ncbi:MAG: 2-dehydro-3-deoxygluconokinase [Firmicutes bacterium]|nr:2-dehydro-3-deoxygluconokinase [Bacillota bacterium]
MCEIITIGEPMALFVANQEGPLEQIDSFTKYVAGAEVNFSVGMSRLEHKVAYITKMGQDPFGKYINKFLVENKINTQYVKFEENYPTGFMLKSKVTDGDPEVFYFRKRSAASQMSMKDISNISWEGVKHFHATGISPALSATCHEAVSELMATARENGVRISFDPNLRPKLWSNENEMVKVINDLAFRSDIVLPGINEGKILTGSNDVNFIADFYLSAGVSIVVIKLGEKGAFVKTKDDDSFIVEPFRVDKVVDTVGAGDGFAVGVISGLIEGLSIRQAVIRGNAIGALAVMSPGDNEGLPERQQLAIFINDNKK